MRSPLRPPPSRGGRGTRLAALAVAVAMTAACSGPRSSGTPGAVSVHTTSAAGERLTERAALELGPRTGGGDEPSVVVDDGTRHQAIVGFGASFLEAGLVTLDTLPARPQQDAVLRALFDPRTGAGFSAMKTPIGGTDFQSASPAWYTYDDTPSDTALAHFSIARDLGPSGLVTYIQRARAAGGRFVLQAPMDYPPDWMLKDVASDQDVDPRYYPALAGYYVKYVQAYEAQGIHVDYVSLFNEPGNYTKIPFDEIRTLLADHVGPAFRAAALTTGIQLSEYGTRKGARDLYPTVMDDPTARSYVASMPYHGYEKGGFDAVADLHAMYPDAPIWMTEICCSFGQREGSTLRSGDAWGNIIFSDLEAGASAWIYWNAILDETGGPWLVSTIHADPESNAQESVVVIDRTRHTVTYTGLYYYLAHFSKYVRPGATRIGTTVSRAGSLRALAFRNADGSTVVELLHSGSTTVTAHVSWRGRWVNVSLPATSITTLSWRA